MYRIREFSDAKDFETQAAIVRCYSGVHDFSHILHYILTGASGMRLFIAEDTESKVRVGAAGVLKSPEYGNPITDGVMPVAYVISDMCTDERVRRKGLGLELLHRMEHEALRHQGRILYLVTDRDNVAAISLYLKAGFWGLAPQRDKLVLIKTIG